MQSPRPLLYCGTNMADNPHDYWEEFLLNPRPGTAAAAARDFGIDLTLTIQNLRLSPEERIRRNDVWIDAIRKMRAARWLKKPRRTRDEIRVSRAFEAAKEYLRTRDDKKAVTHAE